MDNRGCIVLRVMLTLLEDYQIVEDIFFIVQCYW